MQINVPHWDVLDTYLDYHIKMTIREKIRRYTILEEKSTELTGKQKNE